MPRTSHVSRAAGPAADGTYSSFQMYGGAVNVGTGVTVARGAAPGETIGGAVGSLVVGGSAKLNVGNGAGTGTFTLARYYSATAYVTLQDSAVVTTERLTNHWGTMQLDLKGSAQFKVVNHIGGAGTPASPGTAYNSFLGGGNNSDGSRDGTGRSTSPATAPW